MCSGVCSYPLGCGQLISGSIFKKNGSISLRSHQLPKVPQLCVRGLKGSLPAVLECSLTWSCADTHSWYEVMSPVTPRGHISVYLPSTSDSDHLSDIPSGMMPELCMVEG